MFTRLIYSLVFYLITPLIILRLLWRSIREPKYRETPAQRFGFVNGCQTGSIWVHAVSAGETIAAVPLINRFLEADHSVLVTTMTPTGRERVLSLLGDRVDHCYAPYDLPDAVNRFLNTVKPKALVIIDTELWPNLIDAVGRNDIPCFLVNARLSKKSAAGYRRIAPLSHPMLRNLDRVFAQSSQQGKRFMDIGVTEDQLIVTGSIKFDASLPADLEEKRSELVQKFIGRKVFLAASTHEGEESIVLDAYQRVRTDESNILVLAPRHPHRADRVLKICHDRGLKVAVHSRNESCDAETSVYLLDTMGELTYFYSISNLALVGGSLVDIGGHNPMEPASLGIPMLMGKFRRNIDDIADQFIDAGAMQTVSDAKELADKWQMLVTDDNLRKDMSIAALDVMERNQGALDAVVKEIETFIR